MKIADLADDAELLEEIDKLSEKIITNDPFLSLDENKGLKANVDELFKKFG